MSQEPEHAAVTATHGDVVLSPVKRVKGDPTCSETSPAVPAMATEDGSKWSTLPGDLLRRIADSFLYNNDLDYYMCFRGVCPSWRAATDDPKNDTRDRRFRRFQPLAWIVLDEDFQGDGRRVLLNTLTGRFLRRKLPVVLDYYVVGTSLGFFVLADRSPPHAASVLNPLTGYMVRFAAPVPPEVGFSEARSHHHSSLKLALFCDSSRTIYTAAPDSERFLALWTEPLATCATQLARFYCFFRKAAVAGVYPDVFLSGPSSSLAVCNFLHKCLPVIHDPPAEDLPVDAYSIGGSLVYLVGHVLYVLKPQGAPFPFVFQVDIQTGELIPLQSISTHAIFIGNHRCLAVDTNIFPSIEANSVYFTENLGSSAHICKCNIEDRRVERISQAADFVKQDKKFVLVADRPFTIIQLLSSYTINNPGSQMP